MKAILLLFFFSYSVFATPHEIRISSDILNTRSMPFIERESAVALNVPYKDIKFIRSEISKSIKRPLKFLQAWDIIGEAHVTTITPPEFNNELSKYISQEQINQIVARMKIQESDLEILGIGSGKKKFGKEIGETFFVIVKSAKLLSIRDEVYREYLKAGGPVGVFKPRKFYPHITIGFTHEDIHEGDGLLKDLEHSLDRRFKLIVE
jgi:hypothetical protein